MKSRSALKEVASCGKKSHWSWGKVGGGRSSRDEQVESDHNFHFPSTLATEGGGGEVGDRIVGSERVKLNLGRKRGDYIKRK